MANVESKIRACIVAENLGTAVPTMERKYNQSRLHNAAKPSKLTWLLLGAEARMSSAALETASLANVGDLYLRPPLFPQVPLGLRRRLP